jgi:hypothetical protein
MGTKAEYATLSMKARDSLCSRQVTWWLCRGGRPPSHDARMSELHFLAVCDIIIVMSVGVRGATLRRHRTFVSATSLGLIILGSTRTCWWPSYFGKREETMELHLDFMRQFGWVSRVESVSGVSQSWVPILDLPLTSCVTLGNLFHLFESLLHH